MIKDPKYFEAFEHHYLENVHRPHKESLSIFEGLWKEGVALHVLPLKNPMEGLEVVIEIARILNSCSKPS